MSLRVLSVVVATCQMDDAECAVRIVMGYHASLLESCTVRSKSAGVVGITCSTLQGYS